jgi:molybdopterin synthase sulfur carrier subunit
MGRVLLFGRLGDLAGWREREMDLSGSLADLRSGLIAQAPELEALNGPQVQVAIDQHLVRGDADLDGVREVAFLPPFSGG